MWGGVTHQREKVDVNSDGKPDYSSDHDDNGTPNDPDDDMYTYSPIDCTSNCQPLHFTQEEVDNGEAEEQAADALNPPPADAKEPKDDPPKDPPPAPAPTDPAPAPAPDTTQRATDEVWDEEWELMYQNPEEDGSGDSTQCTENPQCREPDDDSATASCAGDDPSCSSGCTGNQGKAEAFGECVQSAISGTTPPGPSEQDPYINPAPEATSGYLPSQVAALAACAGGGVPSRDQCRGEGLALCPEDNPNCMCGGQRVAEVSAALMGADCERMMCSGASSSERSMATNDAGPSSSGVGACGCSSMMGGN